ncbi:MAG: hypothetical protein P9L92_10635 [Candidatus Electryonea clarkiae]|nr:hypothetical protein [Candidatus Electryonea clarkiae]MDP8285304.1 hypothetical protein [Candidatus Electryonea clarkiae]
MKRVLTLLLAFIIVTLSFATNGTALGVSNSDFIGIDQIDQEPKPKPKKKKKRRPKKKKKKPAPKPVEQTEEQPAVEEEKPKPEKKEEVKETQQEKTEKPKAEPEQEDEEESYDDDYESEDEEEVEQQPEVQQETEVQAPAEPEEEPVKKKKKKKKKKKPEETPEEQPAEEPEAEVKKEADAQQSDDKAEPAAESVEVKTDEATAEMEQKPASSLTRKSSTIIRRPLSTIISPGTIHRGLGAPVMKFSVVNNEFATFVGGRFAWLIDYKYLLGVGLYGLATEHQVQDIETGTIYNTEFAYGGLEIERAFRFERLLGFSAYALIGAGSLDFDPDQPMGATLYRRDACFVAEPMLGFTLNVTPVFRISISGGYRYVSGIDSIYLTDTELTDMSGAITLRFGHFRTR